MVEGITDARKLAQKAGAQAMTDAMQDPSLMAAAASGMQKAQAMASDAQAEEPVAVADNTE